MVEMRDRVLTTTINELLAWKEETVAPEKSSLLITLCETREYANKYDESCSSTLQCACQYSFLLLPMRNEIKDENSHNTNQRSIVR